MKTTASLCLVILDGFGFKKDAANNPISPQSMPTWHKLLSVYPNTLLQAAGAAVGLPEGVQGNSEVGHRAIGAGRNIPSLLLRINEDIKSGAFFKHPQLLGACQWINAKNSTLHLVGLVSDGNVHSSLDHAVALAKLAHQNNVKKIVLHAILDGRDVAPESGIGYLDTLLEQTKKYGLVLGSVQGRFYAMDRNNNKEKTQAAYDVINHKSKTIITDYKAYLESHYTTGLSDEFVAPAHFASAPETHEDDIILFFNIRPERMWQLGELFVERNATNRFKLMSLVDYTPDITALYSENDQGRNFFSVARVAQPHRKYAVFAESEKGAHVLYYLTNLTTLPFLTSTVATSSKGNPDNCPEMQAEAITKNALSFMREHENNYCVALNYANADMVGHTGNYDACLKALACLDEQIKKLYEVVVQQQNNILVITADHGNIEDLTNNKRSHTSNLVPFIIISHKKFMFKDDDSNSLTSVAATMLELLEINIPDFMKKSLIKN